MAYTWTWPGGCWSTLLLPMLPSGQGGSIVSLVGWGPRFQKKGVHQTNKNVFYETLCRVISDRTLRPRGVRGFGPLFLFGGIWRGNARDMAWHSVFHFVVTVAGFEGSFVGVAGALVFRMPECTKRTKTSSTKHCVVLLEKTMTLRGTEGHPGFWKLVPPRDMAYPWTWPGGCWSTLLLLRLPSGQRGSIFRALLFPNAGAHQTNKTSSTKHRVIFFWGRLCARGASRVLDAGSSEGFGIPLDLAGRLLLSDARVLDFSFGWMGPSLSGAHQTNKNIFNKTLCEFTLEKTMSPRGLGFGRWFLRGIWHPYPWTRPGLAVGPLCCWRCGLQARGVRSLVWVGGALVVRRQECAKQTKHLQEHRV